MKKPSHLKAVEKTGGVALREVAWLGKIYTEGEEEAKDIANRFYRHLDRLVTAILRADTRALWVLLGHLPISERSLVGLILRHELREKVHEDEQDSVIDNKTISRYLSEEYLRERLDLNLKRERVEEAERLDGRAAGATPAAKNVEGNARGISTAALLKELNARGASQETCNHAELEIANSTRPRWLPEGDRRAELRGLTAPLFLKTVWADKLQRGRIRRELLRQFDPELLRAVDVYVSQRKAREQDAGDARGLTLLSGSEGTGRKKKPSLPKRQPKSPIP